VNGDDIPGGVKVPLHIVQDDHFDTGSVELGAFISDPTDAPLFGLLIEPDPATAWRLPAGSWWTGSPRCAVPGARP
jgi:hypothetical protein